MISWSGVLRCYHNSILCMIEAWRMASFLVRGLVLWRIIPLAILWFVWNERNARVFRGSLVPKEDVLS